MPNFEQAGEAGRAIIADHLIEGGPGDAETLELAATLCNFAPAMLDALREFVKLARAIGDGEMATASAPLLVNRGYAEAILAQIDGTPTNEADDCGAGAAANLSRGALVDAAGEALALATPTARAGVWRIITGTHSAELLYWSNANGWGCLATSDGFTQAERETLNLPIGGQWWFDDDEGEPSPTARPVEWEG